MGDLEVCSPSSNGVVLGEHHLYPSTSPSGSPPLPVPNPDPFSIGSESWAGAEQTIHEIVCRIHPTLAADHKRKEVIKYVQRLIGSYIGCEIFPYGSVPLKTYLPDGDIDLTVLCSPNIEDAYVSDVYAVLSGEEHNEAARYEVKDVHSIDAEVKLVKCIVQNIVVDISFNQLGGLCTLCFLEQVNHLVGKDHLFKRSIILIKAWCYYESRILGAHHGLISTYALETLVLYIFHLFHSSLNGPLAVLYRFLDYFSRFDWDNYCISLSGPVCKSSLPDIVVEVPENGGDDLLLSEEFLRNCVEMFSVPSRGLETNSRAFPLKFLNIIDPLKENNNLGRSVNRGNFYRIRSAFKYGARKLGWILLLPGERVANELNKFFSNTLERHGGNCCTNMQNATLASSALGSDDSLSSKSVMCSEGTVFLNSTFGFSDDKILGIRNEPERYLRKVVSSERVTELESPTDRNAVLGYCFSGDAKELATSGFLGMRSTKDSSDCLPLESNLGTLLLGNSHRAPHFKFSGLFTNNGKIENWNPCQKMAENSVVYDEMGSAIRPELKEKHLVVSNLVSSCIHHEGMASICSAVSSSVANISENISPCNRESIEALKCLLDLSGDYDSHSRNLRYGQLCNGYAVSLPLLPSPPISPMLQINSPWDSSHESLQIKQNVHYQMKKNGVALGPQFNPANHNTLSSAAFGPEEKEKPRGIGTYLPKANPRPSRDRPVPERVRNHEPGTDGQSRRHNRNNGLTSAPREVNLSDEGNFELSHDEYPVLGRGNSGSSDSHQPHLSTWGSTQAHSFSHPSEKIESGSLSPQLWGPPLPEGSSQPDSGTSHAWCSAPSPVAPAVPSPKPLTENNPERFDVKLFHLKNEDDFPPLSPSGVGRTVNT